jgi:formate dehydrogenase maturation protein FdhE
MNKKQKLRFEYETSTYYCKYCKTMPLTKVIWVWPDGGKSYHYYHCDKCKTFFSKYEVEKK